MGKKTATNNKPTSLPAAVKEARIRHGLSMISAARELKTNQETIKKFENDSLDTSQLNVYESGMLRAYCELVGVDLGKYSENSGNVSASSQNSKRIFGLKFKPLQALVATRGVSLLSSVTGLVLVVAAIAFLVVNLLAPPPLEVYSPESDLEIMATSLTITGKTSPGSEVIINGNPVLVGLEGEFNEEFLLSEGLNEIEIKAISSLSREAVIKRTIVADYPSNP